MAICFQGRADQRQGRWKRETGPRQKQKHSCNDGAPMRNQQDQHIARYRDHIENDECPSMPPMIDNDSAWISVNGAKQSTQPIVQTDEKYRCTDNLQILRHETHPKFFSRANHKDCDEQDHQVAFESQEISDGFQRGHIRVLSDWFALLKPLRQTNVAALIKPGTQDTARNICV